jgi:hypothetical protein
VRAHKDCALHTQAIEIRTSDVLRQGTGAGGVSHDEHIVWIAFEFGHIALQIIDHQSDVLACWRPAPLHRHADHALVRSPLADVVVEYVGFDRLLFDLVACTARYINEYGSIRAAFLGHKDVDQILGLWSVRDVAHHRDTRVKLQAFIWRRSIDRPICVVVVLAEQRAKEFSGAARIHNTSHFDQLRFDCRWHLRVQRASGKQRE